MINIGLYFLNDNETLCFIYNDENRLYNMTLLNRQLLGTETGIRATMEVENMEIILTEDYNNIIIDLRILDNGNISDEDWDNSSEPIPAIPIRWYNDNHIEDTEDWYSD